MSGLGERSDEELLQATGGEPTAFGVFYRRHARLVLACAVRRLGDAELAADVTSEVFAAALASSDRFDPARGSARSWLFGILANQVGSALRSRMADSRARRRLGMEPIPLADDQRAWIEADGRLGDLRDVASGGLAVASVGLVVIVLAFMMAPRAHRAVTQQRAAQHGVALAGGVQAGGAQTGGAGSAGTAPGASDAPLCARVDARRGGTWTAAGSAPDEGLRSLRDAAAPVTGLARTVALSHLDQTVAQATTVYADDIRAVRLPGGARVTLIPAQSCATIGMPAGESEWSRPQPSLLAEVASVHGVATIPLGTATQIRSGAAYRSQTLLVRSARGLSSLAMVPPDVVRVVCRLARTGVRRFPVVDHLVAMTPAAASGTCHLV